MACHPQCCEEERRHGGLLENSSRRYGFGDPHCVMFLCVHLPESLVLSSHERKYLAFKLIESLLPSLTTPEVCGYSIVCVCVFVHNYFICVYNVCECVCVCVCVFVHADMCVCVCVCVCVHICVYNVCVCMC